MSCYQVYKTQYQDAVDIPKVLGTFADDYTGGTACILPYKVVTTFQDKSASDFISASKCEFQHPSDPSKSLKLDPTKTGCRIDFATQTRDEARGKLEILQSLYDKNVIERKLAMQAELNRKYEELSITQSNFDTKKKKLDETVQTYYRNVADSNALIKERNELRVTQAYEQARLKKIRETITIEKKRADITVDNLNKTIGQGDSFINFVAVAEHPYYDGQKVTLTPQIYKWAKPAISKWGWGKTITIDKKGVFDISSIIIPPGMTVKIWTGFNYSGEQYKLDHNDAKKSHLVQITYKTTEYRMEEQFSQQEKPNVEHFIPLLIHFATRNSQTQKNKSSKQLVSVPYEVEKTFDDNVVCIEVQKEKSVGEFMDTWNSL
jgi:hypothetical protein